MAKDENKVPTVSELQKQVEELKQELAKAQSINRALANQIKQFEQRNSEIELRIFFTRMDYYWKIINSDNQDRLGKEFCNEILERFKALMTDKQDDETASTTK